MIVLVSFDNRFFWCESSSRTASSEDLYVCMYVCNILSPHLSTTCTPYVHNMYTTCIPHVHHMFTTNTPHIHHMYIVHHIYTTCTPHVNHGDHMYTTCTPNVHHMMYTIFTSTPESLFWRGIDFPFSAYWRPQVCYNLENEPQDEERLPYLGRFSLIISLD